MTKSKRDFTRGPLFSQLFLFTVPIMITGVLQVLYNMADNIVVGQFSGDPNALAAIGSSSVINSLLLNLIIGLSTGAGIVVAHAFGRRDDEEIKRTVRTSIATAFILGIIIFIIGIIISRPLLELIDTKPELLDMATLYIHIICFGIPAASVFNSAAAVLRSVGDSKTPLYVLSLSGISNVILNLIFVIVFNMSVAGVAIATVISQYVSAIVTVGVLCKRKGESYALDLRDLRIDRQALIRILRYGVPAGIQGMLFNISNVIIVYGTNRFPNTTISAKTIANNIEAIIYTALNAYLSGAMTLVGQNYGAGNKQRIKKGIFCSVAQVITVGAFISGSIMLFAEPISLLYIDANDPNLQTVLRVTVELLYLMLPSYVLCGLMETLSGSLRGLGFAIVPMIINLIGACGVRIFWVFVIFPNEPFNTINGLFLVYPISWILTIAAHSTVLYLSLRKKRESLAIPKA